MSYEAVLVLKLPQFPPPAGKMSLLGRFGTFMSTLWLDHAILRYIYNTRHRVAPGVYRSSHPLPSQLRAAARLGIRTVINLRGVDPSIASNRLSWEACERYGLKLVHFPLFSRQAPTREEILGFNELLKQAERPLLLHCKSGADRAGLASALYLMLQEQQPVEMAMRQLSLLRFGHVRQARTGVLDHFFECYRRHQQQYGTPFEEWVREYYDRDAVEASFHHNRWINQLADWLLRRE